jgi:hypothetical protein
MDLSELKTEQVIDRLRSYVQRAGGAKTAVSYSANVAIVESISGHQETKLHYIARLHVASPRGKASKALSLMQVALGTGILNPGTVERFRKRIIHRIQIVSVMPTGPASSVVYYPTVLDTWSAEFVGLIEAAIADELPEVPVSDA